MAKAIDYDWVKQDLDPSQKRKLDEAPLEHADAVLSAYGLLEEARREQVLDLLRGVLGAKTEIMSAIADMGSQPATVNGIRNLITLAKMLGAIDPELVGTATKNLNTSLRVQRKKSPPSLWQLFRRASHPDVRRGLSLLVEATGAIGRAAD
jgi:uncharacterized protein YjgD (DUF1641 family)